MVGGEIAERCVELSCKLFCSDVGRSTLPWDLEAYLVKTSL